MAKYKPYSYDQVTLLPVSFKDQILPGTFEYTLSYVIDSKIDLSVFEKNYNNDDEGRPAIHPGLLLKVVLYAYSKGILHSRPIAEACRTNIIFLALSANTKPHFTTIAAFVSGMRDQIQPIFRDVVLTCMEMDLVGGTLFALDGCKLSSNASKEWSGKRKDFLSKKRKLERTLDDLLDKHTIADLQDCEPGELSKYLDRVDRTDKALEKVKKWLRTSEPKMGKRGNEIQSNITDNESAKLKGSHGVIQGYNGISMVDAKHQIVVAAEASGAQDEQDMMKPMLDKTLEVMDDGGSTVKRKNIKVLADTGFYSESSLAALDDAGVDGYVPDNNFRRRDPRFVKSDKSRASKMTFIREEFIYDKKADRYTCPAGKQLTYSQTYTSRNGLKARRYYAPKSDCASCHLRPRCVQNNNAGPRGLFVSAKAELTDAMRAKIDTREARRLYSKRMQVVEPVFGNQVYNKGMDRFTLRGKIKVNIQWLLYAIVQNMEKIANFGTLQTA